MHVEPLPLYTDAISVTCYENRLAPLNKLISHKHGKAKILCIKNLKAKCRDFDNGADVPLDDTE